MQGPLEPVPAGAADGSLRAASPAPMPAVWIGLPIWGFKPWLGTLYAPGTPASEFLRQYAQSFAAVEGNTTFYGVPSSDTVKRWRDDTPEGFRFCFKFPRAISHEAGLRLGLRPACAFLDRLRPLGARLGPVMLQLPPSFGPSELPELADFLRGLPGELGYAVEFRHRGWFTHAPAGQRARELLRAHTCDWIHLDTRGLQAGPQDHPDIRAARHPKPRLPVAPTRTARHPIVRFIGHPTLEHNRPTLEAWAPVLAKWVAEGARPFLFLHCPNDAHAPWIARLAHACLAADLSLPDPPRWPGETAHAAGPSAQQLSLF